MKEIKGENIIELGQGKDYWNRSMEIWSKAHNDSKV